MRAPSNYVQRAREILREELATRRPGRPEIPEPLFGLYLLLVFAAGTLCSKADVHDAWAIAKDLEDPGHRSLVEFHRLPGDVQDLDAKYVEAIQATARRL